jgi:hypothetical protein
MPCWAEFCMQAGENERLAAKLRPELGDLDEP